jgi:hypothetical protein
VRRLSHSQTLCRRSGDEETNASSSVFSSVDAATLPLYWQRWVELSLEEFAIDSSVSYVLDQKPIPLFWCGDLEQLNISYLKMIQESEGRCDAFGIISISLTVSQFIKATEESRERMLIRAGEGGNRSKITRICHKIEYMNAANAIASMRNDAH